MSGYSDALRIEFVDLKDELESGLTEDGLLMREHEVALVTVTTTGEDLAAGIPGTETEARAVVAPRPAVEIKQVYKWVDGAPVLLGDVKVRFSRSISEASIKGAAWIEIGGVKYTLVEGGISEGPLEWECVLKRMR